VSSTELPAAAARRDDGGVRDIFYVPDKDPNYAYRWANRADRNMIQLLGEGWEVVRGKPELPYSTSAALAATTGQSSETPVSEEVRTRGDLILVRMPRDLHEDRVVGPIRRAQERQRVSLDTLVEQANDQARSALARARQSNIRGRHVFTSTDDAKFETEGVK